MDKITFRIEFSQEKEYLDQAVIIVNGQPLQKIIQKWIHANINLGHDKYDVDYSIGILPRLAFPPSTYWQGDPIHGEKLIVLRCGPCGISECWSIVTHIDVTDHQVIWHDFEFGHREDASLEEISLVDENNQPLTLKFDKSDYIDALEQYHQGWQTSFTTRANISKDPEFGWSIEIPQYFEYFSNTNGESVGIFLADHLVDGQIVDVRRQLGYIPAYLDEWHEDSALYSIDSKNLHRYLKFPEQGESLRKWLLNWFSDEWLSKREREIEKLTQGIISSNDFPISWRDAAFPMEIEVVQHGLTYSLKPSVESYKYIQEGRRW